MAKKKETVPTIELLQNSFRLEHDGDSYILRTHCSCEHQPHWAGTKREWMSTGVTSRTAEGIRVQINHTYKMPWSRILLAALDEALLQFDLVIPPSLTRRISAPVDTRPPIATDDPAA